MALSATALSATALSAQIPDSVFKMAWAWDTILSFESPIPLNDSAIALAARPDFQPAHPDTTLIRESYDEDHGATWLPFDAPLPASLQGRHYWVLGDSGAVEVHPVIVAGTIYIATDPAGWPANRIYYSASLKARRPPGTLGMPAFGVSTPNKLRIRSAPATVGGSDQRPTIRTYLRPRTIEVTLDSVRLMRGGGRPLRARAFQVMETGQLFVTARWPDDDICKGESLLYEVSSGVPRFVARSWGECGE